MARQYEEFLDEDECCLGCGKDHYRQSRTLGICVDCASPNLSGSSGETFLDEAEELGMGILILDESDSEWFTY
jgi:hypothetical protein